MIRRDLSNAERAALRAIVDAPVAWLSPEELAKRMELSLDEISDLLAELDGEGWITPWEPEGRLVVTLTVEAADRLQVQLVEFGDAGILRWAGLGDPVPPPPRSRSARGGDADLQIFERIPDRYPSPDVAAELAESLLERVKRSEEDDQEKARLDYADFPRPTILLGLGMTPWPGPNAGETRGACPVCESRVEHRKAYCLYCDRWGLDHLVERRPILNPAATFHPVRECPVRRSKPDQDRIDREARKRKRRSKHGIQWGKGGQPTPSKNGRRVALV